MTPDIDAIKTRIADCTTYNFGMHNANVLAKQDAPALVEEVERLQGIVDSGRCADCEGHGEHSNGIDSEICRRCNGSGSELVALQNIVDRVRDSVHAARHALHLTGTLDAREVLHHITTALEGES